tara:strand:- start:7894 stop:8070 length:177 start_codon:yes stop_codon:yes gene_type:complete
MIDLVAQLFQLCVSFMYLLANLTGTTYKEINAIIFLIIQPCLILFFLFLWKKEKKKSL